MNQCVPSWDLEDNHTAPAPPSLSVRSTQYTTSATAHDVPMLDYEVAELTWENGHLSMHGLGLPRVSSKPQLYSASPTPTTWTEKPQTPGGTLESIVNQATQKFHTDPTYCADNLVVPLINQHQRSISSTTVPSNTITTVDAIVPGEATGVVSHQSDQQTVVVVGPRPQSEIKGRGSTCVIGCSTRVGSCSGTTPTFDLSAGEEVGPRNRRGERGVAARVPVLKRHGGELSNNNNNHHRHQPQKSVSLSGGSGTFGGWDSRHVTLDTCDKELGGGVGFTTTATTSFGSPGNTSSAALCNNSNAGADDHDSVCHSRPQRAGADEEQKRKSSSSTKRTRDVHNQSERKRRNKINQRMEALQKLVPNSNKTDKASMLDEVIEYLKTLKTQIHMMSTMSFPSMMMPLAMQQQLQMSMMAMAPMGMGMGMGMDLNSMARQNIPSIPSPVMNPQSFMPLPTWDGASHDRFSTQPGIVPTDPFSTFLACHSQPMTMDAYSKMAALYNQQLQQRPGAGSHS